MTMGVVEHCNPAVSQDKDGALADLDCRQAIDGMVHGFYQRLLNDPLMAPVFLEVAEVDLQVHLPIICQYWYKMLLGEQDYQRHMMAKHRAIHQRQPLTGLHHERWLQHFMNNLQGRYAGPYTEKAKRIAGRVIENMYQNLAVSG